MENTPEDMSMVINEAMCGFEIAISELPHKLSKDDYIQLVAHVTASLLMAQVERDLTLEKVFGRYLHSLAACKIQIEVRSTLKRSELN